MTHRSRVDEDDDDEDEQDANDGADDHPLVVLPDDELEGLPRRCEPQERCGRTAEGGDACKVCLPTPTVRRYKGQSSSSYYR